MQPTGTPPTSPTPPADAPERERPYVETLAGGKKRLVLKYGASLGETRHVDELILRRPKGKDMRGMRFVRQADGSTIIEAGLMLDFGARLSGQTPMLVDELEGEDLEMFLDVTGDFFGNGQKPGQNSSPS